MKCECGSELKPGPVEWRVVVGEQTFSGEVEGWYCTTCDKWEITTAELARLEQAAAGHIARNGPVTGQTFRFMRKAFGLPAVLVAKLLATTGETIAGWENGTAPVDRSAWMLLGSLVLEAIGGSPDTRARLMLAGQTAEPFVTVVVPPGPRTMSDAG